MTKLVITGQDRVEKGEAIAVLQESGDIKIKFDPESQDWDVTELTQRGADICERHGVLTEVDGDM